VDEKTNGHYLKEQNYCLMWAELEALVRLRWMDGLLPPKPVLELSGPGRTTCGLSGLQRELWKKAARGTLHDRLPTALIEGRRAIIAGPKLGEE